MVLWGLFIICCLIIVGEYCDGVVCLVFVIEVDVFVCEYIYEENFFGIVIVMFFFVDEVKFLVRVFVVFLEFNRD